MNQLRKFIMCDLVLLTGLCSCAPAISPQELDELQAKLALCRKEARENRDAGSTSATSYMKYEDCKRREGVAQ